MFPNFTRRKFLKCCAGGALAAFPLLHMTCRDFREFDLILVGGVIYDGSGQPAVPGDVGICGGKIIATGNLRDRTARRKIDLRGLAVAPGFIDFHSHSDDELLTGGLAQSKIRQGVTTEVLGQDGDSMAPLTEKMRDRRHEQLSTRYGVTVDWQDFAGYYQRLAQGGIISNAVSMVGQGTLREHVVGRDDRPATPAEITRMQQLARTAFAQGAFGISSGLEYTPGSFADTAEIIALCRAMEGRGIYATHMRNEDDTVIAALQEAVQIARTAGVALHLSHLKASGQRNWHKLPRILARLNEARTGGLPVTFDRYPYVAYNTGLSSLFPLWSRDGGQEAFVARLNNPALAEKIRGETLAKIEKIGGWRAVMVSSLPKNPARQTYEGKTLAEIARNDADPYPLLLDLILQEEGGGSMVGFAMSEENTATLLADPFGIIASDGSAMAVDGPLRRGNPHPRAYGTFPRVLGKYVREQGIMSLAEAIRKMTALPAETLGLPGRGRLQPGFWADLVAFDPQTVRDNATWSDPHQYPHGIPYVLVNGEVVIEREKFTGKLAGQVLRIQ